jgi:tRNA U34 5-carboxymethylaminomethyl modifying enzyme MnmG/GidA
MRCTTLMHVLILLYTTCLQEQRLTPARKRSQMLLLVRDMAAAQSSCNARVLALRDEKRSLLVRLNTARQRLSVINSMLGITGEIVRRCDTSSSSCLQHTLHDS